MPNRDTVRQRTRTEWERDLASPPPWLWDSAAPYFTYLQAHQDNNSFYWGCRLAVTGSASAMKKNLFPWEQVRYEKEHYPWSHESQTLDPDKKAILLGLAEAAIIREGSTFDMFLACWLWNMMLALLENGDTPSPDHETTFSEIIEDHKVPPRGRMLRCFAGESHLRRSKHVERYPRPNRTHQFPAANAWNAIVLWHEVRHRIIHRGSMIDRTFFTDDRQLLETWQRICEEKGSSTVLKEGQRLALEGKHVTACLANYKAAATALRFVLINFSGEKRGHSDAPQPFQNRKKRPPGTVVEVPGLFFTTETKIVLR